MKTVQISIVIFEARSNRSWFSMTDSLLSALFQAYTARLSQDNKRHGGTPKNPQSGPLVQR